MGTGPAGREIFAVVVTTRRCGVLVWKYEKLVFTLSFIKNPYAHLPQNWPLLTQVSLETYQKRAFSETRLLLGFSVCGFPTEEMRRRRHSPTPV